MDQEILDHLTELLGSVTEAEAEYDSFVAMLEEENNKWIAEEYKRQRQSAYIERGASIEALVVAQQEALEGDGTALEELKAIRAQIKLDFPKPADAD